MNGLKTALNGSLNSTESNKLNKNVQKATTSISKLLKLGAVWAGMKQAYTNLIQPSIDLIETTNLFEVSMGKVVDEYGNLDEAASKYYTKAIAFQEKMNEKLATNQKEVMEYQAKYFSMFKSQGIDLDSSYFMSENLTKAGYDIASLYNLNTEEAMDKIRAGIAGQVEPLRAIGIDISESALKKVLDNAGIERSVQQLSYAEKEVARYIAIVDQAKQAQGDFAKTFESPANQIRIFKNQLAELKQVAGSFLVGVFGSIMKYVNAIIMVLKEVLKSFADLFGVDLSYSGSVGYVNEDLEDVNDSIGSASKKAKEFKKQLMGFDEINNITLPSENSSGSGSGATGIDDKLLQSLKDWDNKMDSISGKVQQIRDQMLEWLGFTKDINGNLKWSWDNMNGIAKVISVILGAFVGISLIGEIVKIAQGLKNLFAIIKGGKAGVTAFQVGLSTIGKVAKTAITGIKNLVTTVGLGVEQFKIYKTTTGSFTTALAKTGQDLLDMIPKTVRVTTGIAGLVGSSVLAYQTMRDFSKETIGAGEALLKMTGSIVGATASGALIGSVFGPAGTAIGAVAGAVTSLITGMISYTTTLDESTQKVSDNIKRLGTKLQEIKDNYEDATNQIEKNKEASLLEIEVVKILGDELEELVDSNGRVKEGYKERVSTILGDLNNALGTEYKLTGNQISLNGELINSYKDLEQSIDEYIAKQEERIRVEAYEEKYKETLKKKIELEDALKEATKNVEIAQQEAIKSSHGLMKGTNALERSQKLYNETVANGNLRKAIEQQQELQEELNSTNQELDNTKTGFSNAYKDMLNTTEQQGQLLITGIDTTFSEVESKTFNWAQKTKTTYENAGKESAEAYSEELDKMPISIEGSMFQIKSSVESKTPEVVSSVESMAGHINYAMSSNVDTTGVGRQIVNGVATGVNRNRNNSNLLNALTGLKEFIISKIKSLFGIHSPSKVMADIAQYIPMGMAQGIDDNTGVVFSSMKKLSDGIKVNSKDMALGINQYVDYGQITGEISSKSNVSVGGNIIHGIAQAVSSAMQNTNINVEVEAKTEEGVIVKKVSQGFKDYVTQTGELPFPIPV